MATTFIQLTNKLLTTLNETPLTAAQFSGATGFNGQAKDAINNSIHDIIRKFPLWPFLKEQHTISTSSGVTEYTINQAYSPIDFYTCQVNRNTAVTPAIVQSSLVFMDYHLYKRYRYPVDMEASSGQWAQPQWITRPPTGNTIIVSPVPDRTYVVSYETWEVPSDLVASSDVTAIPDQFVPVIISGGTWYTNLFRENIEAATITGKKFKSDLDDMLRLLVMGFTDAKDPRVVRPKALTGPSRYF